MIELPLFITSLSIFKFLFLSLAVFFILAYNSAYLFLYSILGLVILEYFNASNLSYYIYISLNLIFLAPFLRRNLITRCIIFFLKKFQMLPKISKTEKIALRAGSTWIDEELFSGKPNLKHIFKEPYNELSSKESSFLNNQTNTLCEITNDWEVMCNRDLSKDTWNYLKKEKFFGMIIPEEYGGLGFSALGQSSVIAKIATRSQTLAITVMVPNSLGPAELIISYGTDKQKTHYLPKLANGEEIPCFGLTEPKAGSDATSITADGEVIKDKKGDLKIKLNFRKRYITLGAVATVIGLAFKLRDPNNYLGDKEDLGITVALLKSNLKGLKVGRRHDPLNIPFVNSPIDGNDVIISMDDIIGGREQVGNGWKMLMECLSIGRGISLPATSLGGSQLVTRVVGNYTTIRKQFGLSIGKFEGISEVMSKIAYKNYMLEAARVFIASSIDNGNKPSVINAIAKYHFTEEFRNIINDGMDILAGSAICRGPRNLFAAPYMATPIGITVEGSNIMTRSLIHFGQGAIRCHKYSYDEIIALENNDLVKFDFYLFKHFKHYCRNKIRSVLLSVTRGYIAKPFGFSLIDKYKRKILWASASFAFIADTALLKYGGNMKRKEMLSARFGDILSNLFFATAIIRRFENENEPQADRILVKAALKHCFNNIQTAFRGIYENFGKGFLGDFLKFAGGFYSNINPIGESIHDDLKLELAQSLMTDNKSRDLNTHLVFISDKGDDKLNELDNAFKLSCELYDVNKKINKFNRKNKKKHSYDELVEAEIITIEDKIKLLDLDILISDLIEVDAYNVKDYLSHKMNKPIK